MNRIPGRLRALVAPIVPAAALLVLAMMPGAATAQTASTPSPHGPMRAPLDCAACHTAKGWSPVRQPMAFDHDRATGFALTGRHGGGSCAGCHLDLRFDQPGPAASTCASCHIDVHRQRLSQNCASCHNTTSFADAATVEQHARGRFPLTGAHVQVACESCHTDGLRGEFTALPTDCIACHAAQYREPQSVDHVRMQFPINCVECHDTGTWRGAGFDHAQTAGFALLGRHAEVVCAACHTSPGNALRFGPAGEQDCVVCHRTDHDRRHAGDGIPSTCARCHTVDGWEREPFDHAAESGGFPLLGLHSRTPCTGCHVEPGPSLRFHAADENDCVACHRSAYDATHGGAAYPLACRTCHTVEGWSRGPFDHGAAANGFALLGAHRPAPCSSCHVQADNQLRFPHPSGHEDCVACHRPEYDAEHGGSGYPTSCLTCHDVNDWQHGVFDHALVANGFALLGAHRQAACASCHTPPDNALRFARPASTDDCITCHRADYDREHLNTGFATSCLSCHTMTSWATASFDHGTVSNGFVLSGAHALSACASCHVQPGNQLRFPAPAGNDDCIACHRAEYDREHLSSGFPTTCTSCHTDAAWQGAAFDHDALSGFALVGAHQSAACASCHVQPGNQLRFPPPADGNDCVACHRPDYDREHLNSGFPLTCLSCHNTTTFAGATFDHDARFFPIYSGKHKDKWQTCQECHPAAADLSVFTCLSCHKHDRKSTDDGHQNVNGYAWVSALCLQCHPQGLK